MTQVNKKVAFYVTYFSMTHVIVVMFAFKMCFSAKSDYENLGSNPGCCGQVFHSNCFCSFSCINEYLAIDSGGYVSSHINCSMWLDASQKPRWCLIEQVCQGSKVYSALNGPEDWILHYIRTCLYLFMTGITGGEHQQSLHCMGSGSTCLVCLLQNSSRSCPTASQTTCATWPPFRRRS